MRAYATASDRHAPIRGRHSQPFHADIHQLPRASTAAPRASCSMTTRRPPSDTKFFGLPLRSTASLNSDSVRANSARASPKWFARFAPVGRVGRPASGLGRSGRVRRVFTLLEIRRDELRSQRDVSGVLGDRRCDTGRPHRTGDLRSRSASAWLCTKLGSSLRTPAAIAASTADESSASSSQALAYRPIARSTAIFATRPKSAIVPCSFGLSRKWEIASRTVSGRRRNNLLRTELRPRRLWHRRRHRHGLRASRPIREVFERFLGRSRRRYAEPARKRRTCCSRSRDDRNQRSRIALRLRGSSPKS